MNADLAQGGQNITTDTIILYHKSAELSTDNINNTNINITELLLLNMELSYFLSPYPGSLTIFIKKQIC